MIKIKEAIVVEGKYDKIKLSNLLDALIIETNGFNIYKDKQKLNFIRKIADERGLIVLTDSDHSGFQIRNFVSNGISKNKIKHIYIPDVYGKERRKSKPSKEGKLGVEGINEDVLIKLFSEINVNPVMSNCDEIKMFDLMNIGITGVPNSKENKKKLLKHLSLPEFLNNNNLLNYLNGKFSRDELYLIASNLELIEIIK